jgi:hypothetical protein
MCLDSCGLLVSVGLESLSLLVEGLQALGNQASRRAGDQGQVADQVGLLSAHFGQGGLGGLQVGVRWAALCLLAGYLSVDQLPVLQCGDDARPHVGVDLRARHVTAVRTVILIPTVAGAVVDRPPLG